MIYLRDVDPPSQVTGHQIKERHGAQVRREHLPRYTVWTRHGRCLEEFRRLATARRFRDDPKSRLSF